MAVVERLPGGRERGERGEREKERERREMTREEKEIGKDIRGERTHLCNKIVQF